MKKYALILILATAGMVACGKKGEPTSNLKTDTTQAPPVKIDSLAFEVDTFHVVEKETDCGDGCTTCDLYYERIKTPLMPVHDSVNMYVDTLMIKALSDISSDALKYDLKKRADEFIKSSNDPEYGEFGGAWDWTHHTSIFKPVNEVIAVSSSWGGYVGGAHGMYYMETANFFTNTGNRVTLANLFTDLPTLHKIGLKYFKKDNELDPNVDLIDQGWDFSDEDFKLNENFDITTESITWQFNSYEIGPYVNGAPTVKIPMKELEKILKVKFTDVKIQ